MRKATGLCSPNFSFFNSYILVLGGNIIRVCETEESSDGGD